MTAERSHLAILRLILPRQGVRALSPNQVHLPAGTPGQNAWEIYGMALFTALFYAIASWEALQDFSNIRSWYWQPFLAVLGFFLALIILHLINFLWILISYGTRIVGWTLERERNGVHHFLQTTATSLLALVAIHQEWTLTALLGWLWLSLVAINLLAFAWIYGRWRLVLFALPQLFGFTLLTGNNTSIAIGIIILFGTHMVLLFGLLHPTSRIYGPVRQNFSTKGREVCITIDDGPTEDTQAFLEILTKFDLKAVFFVIGERAAVRPDDLQAIQDAGHLVGNHTMRHRQRWFWALGPQAVTDEVIEAQELIEEQTGHRPAIFRSPVGFKNPFLHGVLRRENLPLIAWEARGFDGLSRSVEASFTRLKKEIRPGSIILLHQGRPQSTDLLKTLLYWLEGEGYRCVIPSDLVGLGAPAENINTRD